MRKFLAVTALVAVVACGEKKPEDTGAMAPATPPAAAPAAAPMDSAAMAKMKADSIAKADSMAKAAGAMTKKP